LLGVQCFLSRRLEAQGSWALRFPAYRHLKFGGIIEGTRWVWREGSSSALELHAGDFYLLTDGAPYCFASDLQATPVDGLAFMEEHLQSDGVVRFNAGEGPTVGTGGRFTFDDDVSNPLLRSLPPLIHIRGDAPAARPLRATLDLLTFETEAAHLGRAAISSSLCRIVLVNILRTHLASSTPEAGWLGALADPQIRTALMLMHGYVGRPWKVADLARDVPHDVCRAVQKPRGSGATGISHLLAYVDCPQRAPERQDQSRDPRRASGLRVGHRLQPGI